jgi:hypothetical protein
MAMVAALALTQAPALAHDGHDIATARQIAFPRLADGRYVLAVDLHTHSVFSDGSVWPDIRVQEAKRDGVYAMAVTEHLEYQPHIADIPHPDRNRSFQVATQAAQVRPNAEGADARPLMVINGSEITKANVTSAGGHINAVFTTDDNALMPNTTLAPADQLRAQLNAAKAQGAFVFWNHPYWYAQRPDGVAALTPLHQQLIRDGLLHGIEVANGADVSDEAFQIALDNNLTILGTSDIHGLIDWDYDLANGGHRTATLVLTASQTADGLKAALRAGQTVAIYKDQLWGRSANVEAVVRGTLKAEIGDQLPGTTVRAISIVNSSPVDYMLENIGTEGFYSEGRVITVRAGSTFNLLASRVTNAANLSFNFRVLNSFIRPREHLELRIAATAPAAAPPR